jgi:hypothetical protein
MLTRSCQYTIGIATGVPVNFLTVGGSSDGDDGFLDGINYVSAESPISYVMTTSYNDIENDISPALATKLCNAYAAAGSKGISVLFSSGDGVRPSIHYRMAELMSLPGRRRKPAQQLHEYLRGILPGRLPVVSV